MTEYTVYSPITGAILRSITVSEADLALNINAGEAFLAGHWPNDTYYITAGVPVALPPRPSNSARFDFEAKVWLTDPVAELAEYKASARAEVNARAGAARRGWITDLPGQDLVYAAKRTEAVVWLNADPVPADLSAFPWIAAEVGITAPTAAELAQIWLNLDALWQAEGARIEALRQAALTTIAAAQTASDITTAVEIARAAL
jgi:hypothetical protein